MSEQARSTAYERFLGIVTAMTLLGALAGGLVLVLRAGQAPLAARAEFAIVSGPGVVETLEAGDPGARPFTEPVAAQLAIDPLTLALPPLNAQAAESPHRRGSDADLMMVGPFGHELVQLRDLNGVVTIPQIQQIAESLLGLDAVITDLADTTRDDVDDDGAFTLTAVDGSAVCVDLSQRRVVAEAMSQVIDPVDGAPSNGLTWSPYGPCGTPILPGIVADVRVGTTPGTYGGVRGGEVCDVSALSRALTSSAVVGASWSAVHSIEPATIEEFLGAMTPVILLHDTLVTDHGFDNGRILPRQAVLQRGTAVLVDRTGMPRVRCLSGSPLRRPQPLPEPVEVRGATWTGFAIDAVIDVPPAPNSTTRFVLVDIRTGAPLLRTAGVEGSSQILAGPVVATEVAFDR